MKKSERTLAKPANYGTTHTGEFKAWTVPLVTNTAFAMQGSKIQGLNSLLSLSFPFVNTPSYEQLGVLLIIGQSVYFGQSGSSSLLILLANSV